MPVAYLERGAIAARAVARIDLGGGQYGTGFLIAPRVLITNNHVIGDRTTAARATANFQYEVNLKDAPANEVTVELVPDELFYTSPVSELDFTVVAVSPKVPLWQFGCLPLIEATGKTSEGEWLTIIQHPSGQRKQLCVRENKFIKRTDDMLWYTTDTMPGSSGSPVFNNDWFVVALHHAGVPEMKDGVVVRQSDGSEKWIANEGVRVSRIVQTLRGALSAHPLLTPMYDLPAAKARISEPPNMAPLTLPPANPSQPSPSRESAMAEGRIITVPFEARFQVTADGQVTPLPSAAARNGELRRRPERRGPRSARSRQGKEETREVRCAVQSRLFDPQGIRSGLSGRRRQDCRIPETQRCARGGGSTADQAGQGQQVHPALLQLQPRDAQDAALRDLHRGQRVIREPVRDGPPARRLAHRSAHQGGAPGRRLLLQATTSSIAVT